MRGLNIYGNLGGVASTNYPADARAGPPIRGLIDLREPTMTQIFRAGATTLVLAAAAAIAPATAQEPAAASPPAAAPKSTKPAAPAGPNITGTWSGQLNQVGSTTPFKFEIAISAKGAQTTYSDLNCAGKLTRAGATKSYVFFVEIITKGRADQGGRCPDGTITLAREGDNLTLGWFGSVQGNTIVAYGTLSKN